MIRNWVTTESGRQFRGRWPQDMPATGEGPYIADLARTVRGACEVVLPIGRADVMNKTAVFEVEPVASWRTGARQALAYAGQSGLTPALALFGEADYLRIYLFLRDRLDGLDLWVWRGTWVHTTNRQEAAIKYAADVLLPRRPDEPVTNRKFNRFEREVLDRNPEITAYELRQAAESLRIAHVRAKRAANSAA